MDIDEGEVDGKRVVEVGETNRNWRREVGSRRGGRWTTNIGRTMRTMRHRIEGEEK